ncbi:hypothetical protein [Hydrogenophilus thermoluteolus]|uniref:hypothetical protein n=1 Tax=Hydrogenophilus thermoluteolus TaxID=297 RepID=UPI003F67A517
MTDPVASSPSEALLRARRRFFGTLALFLLSLLILPFVMDSEPPHRFLHQRFGSSRKSKR